jgi:hypothetical protein
MPIFMKILPAWAIVPVAAALVSATAPIPLRLPGHRKAEPRIRTPSPGPRGGWLSLSGSRVAEAWRGACRETIPDTGWSMTGGVLTVLAAAGPDARRGGDIVTLERFSSFDLRLEFRLTEGANSGIKYLVRENLQGFEGQALGLEYQLLDDERHPDAGNGRNRNRTLASLYDLVPASGKNPKPIRAWNHARIVVRGKHVEHWLNGKKVLEFERGSDAFRALVAESKYRSIIGFGEFSDGHILLQDHGNEVSFRNIRIKRLHN